MDREFVMTDQFDKQWKAMGLDDNDLRRLQYEILANPQSGVVMRGTGGLRKMRFAFEGKGKSGSSRVTYVDFLMYETVYLIHAYPKSEKDNLSQEERNKVKKMIALIESKLERRHTNERI